MANNLKIMISARIDSSGNAVTTLNNDIKKLEDKLKGLTLKADIDPKAEASLKKLTSEIKNIDDAAKKAGKSTSSFGDTIKNSAAKFSLWAGVSTIIMGISRATIDLAHQIYVVDTAMTELNRVSDNFNLVDTMEESKTIADDLGASIHEINEAMSTASRMGLEGQDLYGLTRVAALASSISDLSADEALSNISSTIVQFNMNVSDAISILDQLNAIDNDTVASTKDLSQSISKSGAVAETFGISLQNLLGYTVAIKEATFESGNVIGNSIKGWASRITTMQGAIDGLKNVGVDVFDPLTGEVNRVDTILENLGKRWNSLDKATQQSLSTLIAGRNHVSRFAGLMNNFASVNEVATIALEGSGSAMQENLKYQQSLDSSLKKLSSSWTNFSTTVGEAGLKDLFMVTLKAATDFMNSMAALTKLTDGWNLKLPLLAASVYGVAKALSALGFALKGVKAAAGWIGLLVVAVETFISTFVRAKDIAGETTGELIEGAAAFRSQADSIDALVAKYNELKPLAETSTTAQGELKEVMEDLQMVAPMLTGSLKDQGDVFDLNAQQAKEYANALRGMSDELLNATKLKLDVEITDSESDLADTKGKLDKVKGTYEKHLEELKELQKAYGAESIQELEHIMISLEGIGKEGRLLGVDALDFLDIKEALKDSGYLDVLTEIQEKEGNTQALKDRRLAVEEMIKGTDKLNAKIGDSNALVDEETGELLVGADAALKKANAQGEMNDELDNTISSIDSLASAYKTLQEGEQLSADTMLDLIRKYPLFAKYLNENNGQIKDKGKILEVVANFEREEALRQEQRLLDDITNTQNALEAKRKLYEDYFKKFEGVVAMETLFNVKQSMFGKEDSDALKVAEDEIAQRKAAVALLSKPIKLQAWGKSKSSSSSKKEKSPEELAAEARKEAFNEDIQSFKYLAEIQEWSTQAQIDGYNRIAKRHKQYLSETVEDERNINLEIKELNEDIIKEKEEKDKESFENSKAYIEERKYYNQMSLDEEYKAWNRVQKRYKKDSKEWIEIEKEKYRVKKDLTQKLIDKAKELSDKEKDLDNDILSKQKEIRDHISDLADDISDIYKESYEAQKKGDIKAIDNKIELLDKELAKIEEIYNARMKLIDDNESSEDYKRNLLKLQDEQMEIQKDLNIASLNDDISNKKRREELEKALAEKTNEINEFKHDHEIDLRKKSLQNDLDTKKKEAEVEKGRLDESKENTEKHYDDLINDDKKFAQIRQEVMSGVFTTVLADFTTFKANIGANSELIGKVLSESITDKISSMETQITSAAPLIKTAFEEIGTKLETTFLKVLKDLITELEKLKGMKFDLFDERIKNTAETLEQMKENSKAWLATTDKEKRAQIAADTKVMGEGIGLNIGSDGVWRDSTGASAYDQTAKQIVTKTDTISEMQENSAAWKTASPEERKKLEADNKAKGEAQGWTRGADGVWRDKSGNRVYHTGGTVGGSSTPIGEALHSAFNLNKNEEMAKLLKKEVVINPANFKPRNFLQDMSNIQTPNFSGTNMHNSTSTNNITVNPTINIEVKEALDLNRREVQSKIQNIVSGGIVHSLHKMGVRV